MRAMILPVVTALMLASAVSAGTFVVGAADGGPDGAAGEMSLANTAAAAQSGNSALLCEASAQTRRTLHQMSARHTYTVEERREYLKAIDELLAKDPDDVFLHLDYISTVSRETKSESEAVITRYKELMERHPGNSEYAFLYANALIDANTPDAIARLKAIPSDARVTPLAHLRLTKIYEYGKFADQAEARKQLGEYLSACPASINVTARDYAERVATPEMADKYAKELRARLRGQKDPTLIDAWETVWNMEFLATPAEQDEVRSRVKGDLENLRQIRTNDLGVLSMLQSGYKMTGDKKSQVEVEDRIIAEYPDSGEAGFAEGRRFEDEHPYPKEGDSAEAKQAFYRALLAAADSELKRSPNKSEALRDRFDALEMIDGVSNEDLVAAGEAMREGLKGETRWYSMVPTQFGIARAYVDRNIRLEEVPPLIAEGRADYARRKDRAVSDREPDEITKSDAYGDLNALLTEAEVLVDAAKESRKPEIAEDAMQRLSAVTENARWIEIRLWLVKGKWAELNGRKLDAMLMYRASLDSRVVGYKVRGKRDDAKEGYERLWKELGGTQSGNDAWVAALAGAKVVAGDGWEKASKDLPDRDLTDLNGKTWKLSELKGKVVLINVWATWCGPCRSEHPHLQALYDKVKDRTDIAVMTMSVDDSVGDVAPYMKDKNYTFPVLLASRYVSELTPGEGVPQNWIVGADGKWTWMQIGFGEDSDWAGKMLKKLEAENGSGAK
jgi:thiol-disulfide isomerase/thioredoxin